MSDEKLEKLCEKARKLAPLTLGKPAPNLILTDTTEERWIDMHKLPNDFVVVVFWDPNCGVCKKELPALYERYVESLKPMGVEVYAVAKAVDDKQFRDWRKFIREKGLDWVNVGLTPTVYNTAREDARRLIPAFTTLESLNYSDTYDVYATPKLFVVDKERRFVAKQLSADQIVDLVQRLQKRDATGAVK
jgi:thiol-disulfide isomerase/thioredoxin